MQAGWGGYSPGEGLWLTNYYLCQNTITYFTLAVPAPNVLVPNVFGNGITDILCHKIGTSLLSSASLFLHLSRSSTHKFQDTGNGQYWCASSKRVLCTLFILHVFICIETSSIEVFDPRGSSSCAMQWCVLCRSFVYGTGAFDPSEW